MKKIPQHLGIIMDGNRRWAREHGLPKLLGHKRGYDKLKEVGLWCLDRGIKILTVFAFSTENWKRSRKEVSYLMRLLRLALTRELTFFDRHGIQVRVIGKKEDLPASLRVAAEKAEEATKNNKRSIVNLAINYGGRQEIVEAIRKIVADKLPPSRINDRIVSSYLDTAKQPDPDLLIRTAGEQRLSGFLPWQMVYTELYFTEKYWPEFNKVDFDQALQWFRDRERRFGK